MMDILSTVRTLGLPDWWICAGFVRGKIWDVLHDFVSRTATPDIDVIYFDPNDLSETEEKRLEAKLNRLHPNVPWSVKNQARMHLVNDLPPYTSSEDAISKFPETATALGVHLDKHNNLILTARHGIEDVLNMIIRPTPTFIDNKSLTAIYESRLAKKNWLAIWPKLRIDNNRVE
ncbi:hypothetical protein Back11_09810 [Paenibacillus baekrokdamisoli]|uniref:Nucleotidyltransferase family protein n=2 Tax=Paenibacillus baekrokdamisoli TaxID=1712516 RepID=A0A3G9IMV7_9BACL|nr:hypothetical protein Back11_09810 [Paenibacillus baekrokdamisoli]